MTLNIRRATDDDRTDICVVHVRAIREICSRSYTPEQVESWARRLSPDSYVAVLVERLVVVAQDRGEIVGFGQLDHASGEVEAVCVLPERQGEGIGRALLPALEDAASAAGLERLCLSATLNAVTFYRRAGYAS